MGVGKLVAFWKQLPFIEEDTVVWKGYLVWGGRERRILARNEFAARV